jgi:hypothetical protein
MSDSMDTDKSKNDLEIEPEMRSQSTTLSSLHDVDLDVEHDAPSIRQPNHPQSIKSITPSNAPETVPRLERRGLLGRFTLIPEITIPIHYARRTKWLITAIVALAAAAAPMGSAIILPALTIVSHDFHSPEKITNLSVALYMLSMSIFPLWWSSFSETLGRRTIYIFSFALFVVFGVLSAVATNISMLIVMRMLSGGAAASVQGKSSSFLPSFLARLASITVLTTV